MGIKVTTETDTVIKKIIPYLIRRGYDIEKDIDFEVETKRIDRYTKGYVDLLIKISGKNPLFLIEAKRASKKLTDNDRRQAISYGKGHNVRFVVVTNGEDIQCYNVSNGQPIRWDGKLASKIPTRDQLKHVISILNANKDALDVPLGTDSSLPFRPGLPLKQLNALFSRCHNAIRKIEKDEQFAFEDFAKLLFLKLLEEKYDTEEDFDLPYSYRFHELAERSDSVADQVRDAITSMIKEITKQKDYAEVLSDPIHLKNAKTFIYIVRQLAQVSFFDCSLDSKGAAFEYYVRATLKGKKLGQYFTPRPVVKLMSHLVGKNKIYNGLLSGQLKVVDPACGTGGFLVYLMQENRYRIENEYKKGQITSTIKSALLERLHRHTFFGGDANGGVASAAKMNMIVAGDGHSNIKAGDSLSKACTLWSVSKPDVDIIITNPPFGTSETESLTTKDMEQFKVATSKGQHLFIEKMVRTCVSGGDICTVIDEGVLNTDSAKKLRRWILGHCELRAVVHLPEETFKPNKINVRSSVLLLKRREAEDVDLEQEYNVKFLHIDSLGYTGSGDAIRGFDAEKLYQGIEQYLYSNGPDHGYHWSGFAVSVSNIAKDPTNRFDYKYWEPTNRKYIEILKKSGHPTIENLNNIETKRGKSPSSDTYVDVTEGYALVVKAGSNISKFGELIEEGDYIEKNIFEENEPYALKDGDILVSSTGTGTLGKSCVYRSEKPAIPDGHVTVIRVDQEKVYPEYVCDYIRIGFGSVQIMRLFTGSTGLIELTPEQLNKVHIEMPTSITKQKNISKELRAVESTYRSALSNAEKELLSARKSLFSLDPGTMPIVGGEEDSVAGKLDEEGV